MSFLKLVSLASPNQARTSACHSKPRKAILIAVMAGAKANDFYRGGSAAVRKRFATSAVAGATCTHPASKPSDLPAHGAFSLASWTPVWQPARQNLVQPSDDLDGAQWGCDSCLRVLPQMRQILTQRSGPLPLPRIVPSPTTHVNVLRLQVWWRGPV